MSAQHASGQICTLSYCPKAMELKHDPGIMLADTSHHTTSMAHGCTLYALSVPITGIPAPQCTVEIMISRTKDFIILLSFTDPKDPLHERKGLKHKARDNFIQHQNQPKQHIFCIWKETRLLKEI